MTLSEAIVTSVLAVFVSAGASLLKGWLMRPKTNAEVKQLGVATEVSVSAESREWAREFFARATAAEQRASNAEARADKAETRVDELEAGLIECYGYVRVLRDYYHQHGDKAPALPRRLEALWQANGH